MFTLPDLPYAYDALEPSISERTLHFHHDKHHKAYVEKLNALLERAGRSPSSLEEVIVAAARDGEKSAKLFNNAAQAWNHAFFWNCMTPGHEAPSADLAKAISETFGGAAKLADTFVEKGEAQFGSGWVWLTADAAGKLAVETSHDAKDMVTDSGKTPLLVCDLWEHAYYLDYQNDRKKFLKTWFEALPNWKFAGEQFAAAKGSGRAWRYPAPNARVETS
ncbi:MAG TPA: superoxide dismutase [Caulobacteraceae bacterium]